MSRKKPKPPKGATLHRSVRPFRPGDFFFEKEDVYFDVPLKVNEVDLEHGCLIFRVYGNPLDFKYDSREIAKHKGFLVRIPAEIAAKIYRRKSA